MTEAIRLQKYSSVEEKSVEWLWYPYIPLGKLTVLQGDPGEGKSTFILRVTALLTRGKPMPDGYEAGGPYKVIYQCAEDSTGDTIKPRLIEAGANCEMVEFILDEDIPLTLDDDRLETAIRKTHARMMVLDPFQAFIPQDGDMQSACRMRSILRKLATTASRTSCAIVLIGHMTKAAFGKNVYRGLGSIDIAAIARSILLIERDTLDPQVRYMTQIKNNLAPEGGSIGFCFDGKAGFQWLTLSALTRKVHVAVKRDQATQMLIALLDDGVTESREIIDRLEEAGISRRTILKAKKDLELESVRRGGIWFWCTPQINDEEGEEEDSDD